MKRVSLLLLIAAFATFTAFAGVNQNRSGNRGGAFQVPKELNVSSDQQKKIDAINADLESKASQLRSNTDLSDQERREQMMTLRQQHRKSVNEVLTPEQQAQWAQMRPARDGSQSRDGRGGRNGGREARQRGSSDWEQQLNLSAEQKQQLDALKKEYRSDSQQRSQEYRDAVNQILTPEQQAVLKESRADRSKSNRSGAEGRRGNRGQMNSDNKARLDSLKQDYDQKKKAIEMSRIAPEAQTTKLKELEKQYKADVKQIKKGARGSANK